MLANTRAGAAGRPPASASASASASAPARGWRSALLFLRAGRRAWLKKEKAAGEIRIYFGNAFILAALFRRRPSSGVDAGAGRQIIPEHLALLQAPLSDLIELGLAEEVPRSSAPRGPSEQQ